LIRVLFVGDIVGRPGRRSVAKCLPEIVAAHAVDLVIANAENASGGMGATPEVLKELAGYGVQGFTMGNHVWRQESLIPALSALPCVVRPANYPEGAPGRGAMALETGSGVMVGVLNLQGRVFMDPLDCPFAQADRELARLRKEARVILVDFHAEATSEKVALGWYLDGRCTAVLGTHTHVQTADEWIMPQGTAFISDVGMCGPYHSVIGVECSRVIGKFLTGMPRRFDVAKGPTLFSAVLVEADEGSGRAVSITRLMRREPESGRTAAN